MSQKQIIKDYLFERQGLFVCHTDILQLFDGFINDSRKRISEIKDELPQHLDLESDPCRRVCGRRHGSNVHKYRIVNKERLF